MRLCRCGHSEDRHHGSECFQYPDESWDCFFMPCGSCNECLDFVEETT